MNINRQKANETRKAAPDGYLAVVDGSQVAAVGRPRGAFRARRVYWSDETIWLVPAAVIDEFGVAAGLTMDAGARRSFWDASQKSRAKLSALGMLAFRDQSLLEIRRKLAARGYMRDSIEYAIAEVNRLGLVDERLYAMRLAESKLAKPGKGERAVKSDLAAKGISREIAEDAVSSAASPEQQYENAMEWLRRGGKKYAASAVQSEGYREKNKLAAALYRRGYGGEVIRRVLSEVAD